MKNRLFSLVLCLLMICSACACCLTGCSQSEEEGAQTATPTTATTLVMWCVTEEGTDDEQAAAVAKAMSELTKADFNTKLIVKYLTMDEYYEALEAALEQQQLAKEAKDAADKKAKEDAKRYKAGKMTEEEAQAYLKALEEAERLAKEEAEKLQEQQQVEGPVYDEDGNLVIDTTVYPAVEDYQVDILYISGYDKYTKYIENGWLSSLTTELGGDSINISNYVSTSLLNATQYNGDTYAIPNNNIIGEYTYMMIDKVLFDRYYYTGYLSNIHSVVDLEDFLADIVKYEDGVLPIDGDVDYCMSLIADYWDIDPETLGVTGDFSVLGYAFKDSDTVNRGDVAIRFDSLLTDETYQEALKSLMAFKFNGYFGTPTEGQRSAVTFMKGDTTLIDQYEDQYYAVVVDYPRAVNEDIYDNMFAVSAFTSNLSKSMQIITALNADKEAELRNLFQYGIKDVNYTLNADGTVTPTKSNAYHMDIAKTGNQFIAYVPQGTNLKVWEYAKQQNRESTIDPRLGFDFTLELIDNRADALLEDATDTEYVVEYLDIALIERLAALSADVWDEIYACQSMEELEVVMSRLSRDLSPAQNADIRKAMIYEIKEPAFDADGELKLDNDGNPSVENPTVDVTVTVEMRTKTVVTEDEDGVEVEQEIVETYLVKAKAYNPYQIYVRWMTNYGYKPADFGN